MNLAKLRSKFTVFGYELSYAKIIAFIISATLLGLFAEFGKDLYSSHGKLTI